MIELQDKQLKISFPEVHSKARMSIDFQRTLRIPDDNREYPLPPGLGRFPLVHTEDYADTVPAQWVDRGGVILPMYQSEALWINFSGRYPFAIKIAAGKINAVTGEAWEDGLNSRPQDYVTTPEQPWLDGFHVDRDRIRQFVAMPLGEGFSAEEQITGKGEVGGVQLIVYPMKAEVYRQLEKREEGLHAKSFQVFTEDLCCDYSMALAPGGLMRQRIYEDPYGIDVWDTEHASRCFVHLANSEQYAAITGQAPPQEPPSAERYTKAGLPWFDYYDDAKALKGSSVLAGLDSVEAARLKQGNAPDPTNRPVEPKHVRRLGPGAHQVKEGQF